MLYIANYCNGNLCFRRGTHYIKRRCNVLSDKQLLATQLSDEICNILPVFPVLTGCDYTNLFYRRSKIQSFKRMFMKPELNALIQFLKTQIRIF